MKKIIAVLCLSILSSPAFADPSPNYYIGMPFVVSQGSVTLSGNTTFYGSADSLKINAVGSDVRWSATFAKSTGVVLASNELAMNFSAPVSSPTIIRWTIPSGATAYYTIGGRKND